MKESSKDPGGPKQKPSILLNRSYVRKVFRRLFSPASSGATFAVGKGRQRSEDKTLHCLERKSCLSCSVAAPPFANHALHTRERPEASAWFPLQPRWQQRTALHQAKASVKHSCHLLGKLGSSRSSCLQKGNASGYGVCIPQ